MILINVGTFTDFLLSHVTPHVFTTLICMLQQLPLVSQSTRSQSDPEDSPRAQPPSRSGPATAPTAPGGASAWLPPASYSPPPENRLQPHRPLSVPTQAVCFTPWAGCAAAPPPPPPPDRSRSASSCSPSHALSRHSPHPHRRAPTARRIRVQTVNLLRTGFSVRLALVTLDG